MQTIRHQCVKFSAACSAGFEHFNLEECINSVSYENFNKENQEEGMGQVPPDVHAPQPSPFADPSHAPHPPPFVTPGARAQTSSYVVPSPTPQPPPFVPSSSTPDPSPYVTPIPATQPPPFVPSSSTPERDPHVIRSPKPQAVPFVILSPTPHPPPIVIPSPTQGVSSMVGRMKGSPRKRIIPPRLSPYVLGRRTKRPQPNPQYSLTPEEDMILDKFWNGYYRKFYSLMVVSPNLVGTILHTSQLYLMHVLSKIIRMIVEFL
ncbi:hypothetical protein MRB53_032853 [Persea americana]|uniref:Uncharacterized protein n=1 Tax=Persea americana TaxID=3435 RepID=A0ACC2KTM3_PERAE|nr:hypothetical protein MRB53_032853 [Persea americana]